MEIRIKRAFESPDDTDGHRILVDRLWPRGISKELHLNNAVALKEYIESLSR
ncbi:MAG: DUF488 family protein [Bacteroidales bacterium]|nr:MAG: DUF488 family protein [Bacteroidales bacterium]